MISNGRVGAALFLIAFLLSRVSLTFGQIEVKDILFAADDTTMRGAYWDKDGFYHKDQDVQFSIIYERADFDTVSGFLAIFSEDKFFETVGDTIRGDTTWVLLGGTVFDQDPTHLSGDSLVILRDSSKVKVDNDGGVIRFDVSSRDYDFFKPPDALVNNQVSVISVDPYDNGAVWIGTAGGISRYEDGSWESFTTSNNNTMTNNVILAIVISESNVWFGTRGGGLLRWNRDPRSWSRYDTKNSRLANDEVSAIAVQGDSIWIGTLGNGIDLFDSNRDTVEHFGSFLDAVSGSSSDSLITSIAIDSEGNKWVGTAGGGVARFNEHQPEGERWTVLRKELGTTLSYNYVNAIVVDRSSGDIWVGTESAGAFRIRSGSLTPDSVTVYTKSTSELIDNCIKSIAIDGTENKWFATPEGVSKLDKGGHWEQFTCEDFGGFGSNVWAVAVTDNMLWFGRRPTKYSQVVWDVSRSDTVSFSGRSILPDLKVRLSFIDNYSLEVVDASTFTDTDPLLIDNESPRVRNLWPNSRSKQVPADSLSISAFVDDATLGPLGVDTIIVEIDGEETILKVVPDSLKKGRILREGELGFPELTSSRRFFDGTEIRHNNLVFPVRLKEGTYTHNIRLEVLDRAGHHTTIVDSFTVVQGTEGDNIGELINYPNPFATGSGGTIIRYVLGKPSYVTLRIFDVSGALVKGFERKYREAGAYDEIWDGRDFFGGELSNGVYFCELIAIEQETQTERRKYTKIAILR